MAKYSIPDEFSKAQLDYLIELMDENLKKGISFAELSRIANIAKSTIKRWYNREVQPGTSLASNAIEKWGGNPTMPYYRSSRSAFARIMISCEKDKDLSQLLDQILKTNDPDLQQKLKVHLKSFIEMNKVSRSAK